MVDVDEPAREELDRRGVSSREFDVLEAVADRMTNAEIAARLCVSERTVESHVSSLLRKLGVRNRVELADWMPRGNRRGVLGDRFPDQFDAIASRGVCVGRDDELQRLLACWDRAATRTTVAVVRGEAGIGKSRLAAAVAVEVHRRGGGVALGLCSDGPQRPYEPFMTAIEADLVRLSDDELARRLGAQAGTFARLSSHVATRLDVGGQDVVDPERERAAVQGALYEYLARAAYARRLLFVVEDLHWATAGTREVIAHISRSGGAAPLMMLVTTRDAPPYVEAGFGAFLGRLAGVPSVEMIPLAGLDVSAAASLIDAVGSDLDPEQGVSLTGGNPLFLREVAREGPGSRTLGEMVSDRFDRLGRGDLDVVDIAAVAGDQIDVTLIASALDRSTADVLDSLERTEETGLLGPGTGPGRFAFTHDVYRSVRYASLTTSRKLRLHAALAVALSDQATAGKVSADLARHACLAGPRFDPTVAADLARQAGNAAADATDHGEAAAHYRRALEVLDIAPDADGGARLELGIRLGASLVLLGDSDGLTMLRTAADTALRQGDAVALAQAVCSMAPSPGATTLGPRQDPWFRSVAGAALEMLPPSEESWRIRVLALLGAELWFTDVQTRGAEMIRSAVRAARRLGDPVTLGQTLLPYRFCLDTVDMDERLACGRELIELGDRTGLEVFACVGRQQLTWCYRELGDLDEMNRWDQAAEERVHGPDIEQMGHAAAVAFMQGGLERVLRIADELDDVWRATILGHLYASVLRTGIAACRGQMGDLDLLERGLTVGEAEFPPEHIEPMLARGFARTGRTSRARDLLDRARQRGFPTMYAGRAGAAPISSWAETAAIVQNKPAGAELDSLLEPLAGRLVDCGIYLTDTVDRVRALLRLSSGDAAGAEELATRAIAASRRRRTPIFLARELVVLAAARQHLRQDVAQTADAVEEALAIARRTGARIVAQDAALLLTEPIEGSPAADQFGLTAREREILDHLADGATNTQIAAALGISPATVRKHLEHAYGKLQVSTRTAAAARIGEVLEQRS
jgi:DNA-binding NarL/FixJ family response regulator